MKLSARSLTLLAGFSLAAALPARAQFIELLTEAPVNIQVTLTTTSTTETATERKTTTVSTSFVQADIIEELRASGLITTPTTQGWTLVAVRAAPADLAYIDGAFFLYAVNGAQRVFVPSSKFKASNVRDGFEYGRVAKYTERYLGQYVLNSSGTATVHAAYHYQPVLTVPAKGSTPAVRFDLGSVLTDGFGAATFQGKDLSDGHEAFFYAISSLRSSTRGSYVGTAQIGTDDPAPAMGLVSISVIVGTPKLVPASLYPEVDYFHNPVSR